MLLISIFLHKENLHRLTLLHIRLGISQVIGYARLYQWPGRFLGITGWGLSVCKSNRLHVHILRISFIKLGYIL